MPLFWFVVMFIWGMLTKIETRKKKLLWGSFILIYFFSNSFIVDEFYRAWEVTTTDLPKTEKYEYAVVLGGMIRYDERQDKPQFMRSADRLHQAVTLLKTGQVKKLILSGGSGSISFPDHKEAKILKDYLVKNGVADSCIIIENESKNTRENALNTKHLMDSLKIKSKFLLITSSFHMRRSMGCFNKVGLSNYKAFPTDRYSGGRKFAFDHCLIPNAEALEQWTLLIHEVFGHLVYKIRGFA